MTTDAHAAAQDDDEIQQAITRYRRAAEQTLDQLDWCVDYLYGIGKPRIARAIRQNRTAIRRRMRESDD